MRFSDFFVKTLRTPPRDEESVNSRLLVQAGFVNKLASGLYTFLPPGLRVLDKIENIVREGMNNAGGAELLMPTLHPAENWSKTGRWQSFDALFKTKGKSGSEYALGPTHEEVIYPLLKHFVSSYKDLPKALYQIQTKFRDEPRAKSGLLRTREFRMKDLYSFHTEVEDRDHYYEVMRKAYLKVFKRLDLEAVETKASGGTFSEFSAEFQVVADAGEDTIYYCHECKKAINQEIVSQKAPKCPECGRITEERRAIEVGNIFPLKKKFAEDFNLTFKDEKGKDRLVEAGCYGLGTSRAMGAIVETHHDDRGIVWPEEAAPFKVHLINLIGSKIEAEKIYEGLGKENALYDDRSSATATAGEKFMDADLIGIPWRIVISEKTMADKKIEIKRRDEKEGNLMSPKELIKKFGHAG